MLPRACVLACFRACLSSPLLVHNTRYDKDGDGQISWHEFLAWQVEQGMAQSKQRAGDGVRVGQVAVLHVDIEHLLSLVEHAYAENVCHYARTHTRTHVRQ